MWLQYMVNGLRRTEGDILYFHKTWAQNTSQRLHLGPRLIPSLNINGCSNWVKYFSWIAADEIWQESGVRLTPLYFFYALDPDPSVKFYNILKPNVNPKYRECMWNQHPLHPPLHFATCAIPMHTARSPIFSHAALTSTNNWHNKALHTTIALLKSHPLTQCFTPTHIGQTTNTTLDNTILS
jgi:hypothetical protein